MENKCSKYEGLFVFTDDATLRQHLQECEECRKEQEKMDRVSELIGEVKSHYYAKKKRKPVLKIACILTLLLFSTASIGVIGNYDLMVDTLQYGGDTLSAEELGFPVDSYGLIVVGE